MVFNCKPLNGNPYYIPKRIVKTWVEQQYLLLLLDGLDEIPTAKREACIVALNQFQQRYSTDMVVCSRVQDYMALSSRLNFQSAIYLRFLTLEQVQNYLKNLNADTSGLRILLETNTTFQELACSPLMLNIMVITYQGVAVESLPNIKTEVEWSKQIFNSYIQRMFRYGKSDQQYSREQTIRWLSYLARQMKRTSQTVFLIEEMQPTWLHLKKEQRNYNIANTLVGGILGSLVALLTNVPVAFLKFGNVGQVIVVSQISGEIVSNLIRALLAGLFLGLLCGLGLSQKIKPVEKLAWSWQAARSQLIKQLLIVLLIVLGISLIQIMFGVSISFMLSLSLVLILILGLIIGFLALLFGGLTVSTQEIKVAPNQSVWNSAQNSISGFLIYGLISILFCLPLFGCLNVALSLGLGIGLIGCLRYGGLACIQHFILRLILYKSGFISWNYAHFLNWASKQPFLQKVGGGYIFVHRSLMEHFAQMGQDSQIN